MDEVKEWADKIVDSVCFEWYGRGVRSVLRELSYIYGGADMVDPIITKLVESRKRSISKLDEEIKQFEERASRTAGTAQRVFLDQAELRRQRKARLLVELEAVQAVQPELQLATPGPAPAAGQVKPPAKR